MDGGIPRVNKPFVFVAHACTCFPKSKYLDCFEIFNAVEIDFVARKGIMRYLVQGVGLSIV